MTPVPLLGILLLFCIQENSIFKKKETNWRLVWSDEFNYKGLPDSNKWNYEVGYIRNDEQQFYTSNRLKNARVEKGFLIIESHKEDYEGYKYTSASLHNKGKGDWLNGKIEIRAKLPGRKGTLAALWMLPTNGEYGDWLKSGEADLMECVGFDPNKIHFTVHTEAFNEFAGTKKGNIIELAKKRSPQTGFHTYSMEWYPNKMLFYMDEILVFQFDKTSDNPAEWPFNKHFHLIMSLAVGGTWAGSAGIDENSFPQRMMVDYVRIFRFK